MKILLLLLLLTIPLYSQEFFTRVTSSGSWEVVDTLPFDELLLSWNGHRPEEGKLLISLSVRSNGEWSPEIPYMEWHSEGQTSFEPLRIGAAYNDQDCLFLNEGAVADGFRVRAEGKTDQLTFFSAACSLRADHHFEPPRQDLPSLFVNGVEPQSQMALDHPHHRRICSPTSTSMVVHFLGGAPLDPIAFSQKVYDERFDIYGNWVLNVAEASNQLGGGWRCHVERLSSFEKLHAHLARNLPVVVSVRGALAGAPQAYAEGHLMVVVGYDREKQRVAVIDPAFPTSEEAVTSYLLNDFLAAWGARRNLAYLFDTSP